MSARRVKGVGTWWVVCGHVMWVALSMYCVCSPLVFSGHSVGARWLSVVIARALRAGVVGGSSFIASSKPCVADGCEAMYSLQLPPL